MMAAASPAVVTVQDEKGKEFELPGSRPCIWAGNLENSQYLVEWVLPLNRAQATAGTMMFQPVMGLGQVAKKGGGWVLALLDMKSVHAHQTGFVEREGKEELQVRFEAFFVRLRVLGLNEKRAKDGVPMTLVRE